MIGVAQAEDPLSSGVDTQNPWPGLVAFTEDIQEFFHGRAEEADDLLRRVNRKNVTVLFSQSGLGKSSLLQAGLFPLLRAEGFIPVAIRLDHASGALELSEQVKSAVNRAILDMGGGSEAAPGDPSDTLWEYFHRRRLPLETSDGRPIRLGLVFDQFEELFAIGQANEESRTRTALFLEQLADLVENRAPTVLVRRLKQTPQLVKQFAFDKDDHRVLICLREDYLAHLESLRQLMPSVGENRMRLTRMNGRRALEAVINPGRQLITREVGCQIVHFVAGRGQRAPEAGDDPSGENGLAGLEVEPSLLSLVCRELNNRRLEQRSSQITSDLLGDNRERILQDFYERCVADQPPAVREFVEDELVTDSGLRENIALEQAQKKLAQLGASATAIDELVKRRLLHLEERLKIKRVELAHDVLTPVIKESRDQRQQQEAVVQAEQRAREAREKVRRQRKKQRLVVAGMAAALLVVSSIGTLISVQLWQLKKERASRALAQVGQLLTSRAAEVLPILKNLESHQQEILPRLRELWDHPERIRYDRFDLRLMSWSDGRGVPTSGNNLVIVGADNFGLLHIRIYDAGGKLVDDTDETRIPSSQAGAISTLKKRLSGLLPPHELTDGEKAQFITEATSIAGQTAYDQWQRQRKRGDTAAPPAGWTAADYEKWKRERMRVGMALLPVLPVDPAVKQELYDWMLSSDDPREVVAARDTLKPYKDKDQLSERLWRIVEDRRTEPLVQFRSLVALADYDSNDERWKKTMGNKVVQQLLKEENRLYLQTLLRALEPVRGALLAPLRTVFIDPRSDRRYAAASVLEYYTRSGTGKTTDQGVEVNFADLVLEADDRQFAVFWQRIEEDQLVVVPKLRDELNRMPPLKASEEEFESLAGKKANAAVTLLRLKMADDRVWKLLRHSEDPSVRTHIVHRLNPYGVPVKVVVDRLLKGSPEVSERRALILSLGEYPLESPLPEERQKELQPLLSYLADEYLSNPDAGVHSSVEWLLRRWKPKSEIRLLQEKLHGKPAGTSAWDVNKQGPTWEVNKQGQTFVIIPKVHKFMMGSPEPEFFEETGQLKGIPRCYAIGAKEVTVAQFKKFLKPGDQSQHHDKWQHRDEKEIERFLKKYSPDDDGPMIQVDWFWAAAYCNWLSKQEGIPEKEWCYPDKLEKGKKMAMDKGFLERKGYRLPTEAEWEYACRADATTSRFYGRSPKLLGNYAWSSKTTESLRTHPGGLTKPNDFGIFDVYGNVWEWCQDAYTDYPHSEGVIDDLEQEDRVLADDTVRVLRGGAFLYPDTELRSAYRYSNRPALQIRTLGFRVARTCP